MTWASLLAFNIALLVAILSPGPAFLYQMHASLTGGMRGGLATAFGLGTMASLWMLAALLGLESLFRIMPWAYLTIKVTGALYLLYIAWVTWKNAAAPLANRRKSLTGSFWGGFKVNLANPKSMLFAGAVIVVIFPGGLGLTGIAIITANQFLVEVVVYALMAFLFSRRIMEDSYLRVKTIIDRIEAGVLGALGFRLLIER